MRVLLDECLPRRLTLHFHGHEIVTVPQAGWAGLKNGKLLSVAQESFDVFVTVDQNLVSQQNIVRFEIAVYVIDSHSNNLDSLVPLVPQIQNLLDREVKQGVHRITS